MPRQGQRLPPAVLAFDVLAKHGSDEPDQSKNVAPLKVHFDEIVAEKWCYAKGAGNMAFPLGDQSAPVLFFHEAFIFF
jgi:hypothetical protein